MSPSAPEDRPSEDALLAIAREAAGAAAEELMARYGRLAEGLRAKSTPTDLVSEADLAGERAIRALLAERRPGDAILGEEGGETGTGALRWVVDPLDGTVNYLYGIPQFSVSVAVEADGRALAGVVLDPVRGEEFTATASGGPELNGAPLAAPSRPAELAQAMIGTGFAYDAETRRRQGRIVAGMIDRVRDIRRLGSAALDLCWAAAGRYDAYFERGVKPWDIAAGTLVTARAGLVTRELPQTAELPFGIVVAPPAWIDELHALVAAGQ